MLHSLLMAPFSRSLVCLLCVLMAIGGQPMMALEQNIRIVPGADTPDWLSSWVDGEIYSDAWVATASWTRGSYVDLQRHLDSWWDGSWTGAWDLLESSMADAAWPSRPKLTAASGPTSSSSVVAGQVPLFVAVASAQKESLEEPESGPAEQELKKLSETDSLARPGEAPAKPITKAEPMPNAEGLRVGGSSFRPPKELIQQLDGKADLDNVPLIPGLNLLSLPEEPTNTDPATVFNAIGGAYTKVWVHELCDTANPWKIYDPNDPAGTDLTEVDHTNGFWLEATSPVDLPSDGTLPATTAIELCPGWNLIGFPAAQARPVANALHSIEGKYLRVFGYDASDADDPWEVYSVDVPEWANDLVELVPGRGYWVLATETTTLTIANEGPDPVVEITSPEDLGVVTDFTNVIGTVQSPILDNWRLTYERIGETEPVEIASGVAPVAESGVLGTFDPTLLINGLYELRLEATDLDGRVVEDSIAVAVEGNMKIGHFTLSFVDLAIPLSGLDIEIVRTYDSRQKDERLDFGQGWSLDIRQGSYQNNRPPGDGWQIVNPGGLFDLPCSQNIETKSHLTTVRLSDQEIYRFRLSLIETAILLEGCQARAVFEWVDGPLPGTTLEVPGDNRVIYENGSDRLIRQGTLDVFEPEDVKLTTRDGRIFHLNLETGVTHLEDLNGNTVDITVDGISHSSGVGIDFQRDARGRIQEIIDLRGNSNLYQYDDAGDLVRHTDRAAGETRFTYREHYLEDIRNALGVRSLRSEYDDHGRLVRHIDADGKAIVMNHDLENRQAIVTNRLGQSRLLTYDTRGNVVREVDELGAVTERAFDGEDNVLTDEDPLGRVTTFTYTAGNDMASTSNALGETTQFTYNDRGQIQSVTDPLGGVTTSTYDDAGNLLSTTDALDQTTKFVYDGAGNLTRMTDAMGYVTEMSYDARGDMLTETDALGHVTSYSYDAAGNRLSESRTRTLPDGSTESLGTTFVYDELDRMVSTTAPDGAATSTAYDALGRVTSQTDALGRVTRMEYDALGQLTSTTYPDGKIQSQTYDAEGRPLTRTDRGGRVTTMAYDAVGRLLTTKYADGATQSETYDAAGQMTATTDARGNTTTLAYDAAGRRISMTNALDQATSFGFDANGNQTVVTDARGHTTEFTYDELGQLVTTTYADDTTTHVGYDALGRRTSETDQAAVVTRFAYDALGRLTSVIDALDQVTSYTYDELGNRLTQTDANGHTTSFEYDRVGRQVARILPDDARESMTYYDDGALASHTSFSGDTRTFEYDENRRLVRRAYPDGTQHLFSYTATGQRETATDSRGVTSYAYDVRDRLLEKQDPNGHRLAYTYDVQGNLETLTATVGAESYTTSYGYDALNRQVTVTDPQGGVNTLSYDANGNRASLTHANGVATTYDYDPLNRLESLETVDTSANVLQSYAYSLLPTGHRSQIAEADGTTRSYEYDDLYRLTQDRVTDGAGELVYQHDFVYDPVGNRLSQTIDDGAGPTVISSTYDTRDRLLTVGSTAYLWDQNGSLTARGPDRFEWDLDNRLRSAHLLDGTRAETVYDVDGNRVQSTRVLPNRETSVTTRFLVESQGSLSHVAAQSTNGDIETTYVRFGDELVSSHRPIAEEAWSFHLDGLGSVRRWSNFEGAPEGSYSFSAFGQLLQSFGEEQQAYRFAGEPYDQTSALYFNRARWLDPSTGRFLSIDPFSGYALQPSSLHRYIYVEQNPVNLVDPSGQISATAAGQLSALGVRGNLSSISLATVVVLACVSALVTGGQGTCGQPPEIERSRRNNLILFRGVKAKPKKVRWKDFRFDDVGRKGFPPDGKARGLSVFEIPTPSHDAHLPFRGFYFGRKRVGTVATITSLGGLPIAATARYTPIPRADPDVPAGFHSVHWDIDFPLPQEEAQRLLQDLARQFLRGQ